MRIGPVLKSRSIVYGALHILRQIHLIYLHNGKINTVLDVNLQVVDVVCEAVLRILLIKIACIIDIALPSCSLRLGVRVSKAIGLHVETPSSHGIRLL